MCRLHVMADPGVIVPEVAAPQPGNDDIAMMDLAAEEDEDDDDMMTSLPPMVSITRVPKEQAVAAPALKIRSDLGPIMTPPPAAVSSRGTPPPLLRVGAAPRPGFPPMPRLRLGAVRGTGPAAAFPLGGGAGMMNPHHNMMAFSSANSMMLPMYHHQPPPIMSQAMMATNAQLGLPVIAGTMSLNRGMMQQHQRLARLQHKQQQQQQQLQQQQQQQQQQLQQQRQMASMRHQRIAGMQQQQRATGLVRQRTTFNPSMLPQASRPVQVIKILNKFYFCLLK